MKKLIYLLTILFLFSACEKDDENSPQDETLTLNTSNILVSLPSEIDTSILSELEVSNAYGNYSLNTLGGSAERTTVTYNSDVNYLANGLMITNVINQNGDMIMCSIGNPSGETINIDAEQTALSVLMTHPLLITSDKQEYDDAVAYIKTIPEFQTYKIQVESALADGLTNQHTPNYAGLSGYKPVLMALINSAFDNSTLNTPSLVRINQPIQRNNGKLTFTVTNEHKRVLHMYPKKVNVGDNGVTITSSEYVNNEYGFPQIEILEPNKANYWKIVTGSLMGDNSSPFEATSDPIEVDLEGFDKMYYEIYGLGKLSQPFSQYTQEEKLKILLVSVHGAYNDFLRPIIDLAFGIGDMRRASGSDNFHYDLRYGSRTHPETQLILKLWEALKTDTQTQTEITQSLFDKDFTGVAQELVVFCIDEMFRTPNSDERVTYLNLLYNIGKKYSGISSTSDDFRDNLKKLTNQITHVKHANFAGKVIRVGELSTDIAGAIYAYYNTEIKHTIIVNREEEPYLTLLTPTSGQVFDSRGIVNFTWNLYRADVIGEITYEFKFTVIEPDNTQLTYTQADITDNSFIVDLNNDVNTTGINNFYWQVIAKNAQNEVVASSDQFSFSIAQETPLLTTLTPTNITVTSATGNAEIVSQGSSTITTVGFCWSTNPNPTIDDSFSGTAYTTDTYSLPIQGLQSNTNYFLRAYAQNSSGTGYGEEIQFTTTSTTIPTDGLIAYYPFNGNANDESENNHNGTVNGATLTADRHGNPNSAYSFDGIDDYIQVPNTSSLNNFNDEISFSAWININDWYTTNGDYFPLISKSNSANDYGYYRLFIESDRIYSMLKGKYSVNFYSPNIAEWIFICVTLNSNESKLFINGNLISSQNLSDGPSTSDEQALNIGKDPLGITEYSNGLIDDIRIYNRVLTEVEIQALLNE